MTTWTDETTTETAWAETSIDSQVIDLIDNKFIFDYKATTINGKYQVFWEDESKLETAWV